MPATDGLLLATPMRHPTKATLPAHPGRGGSGVVFWLLVLMGLSTFAPCVLLPQWRQYQAVHMVEQVAQHRLDMLNSRVGKERRLLDALRSDPVVVARLAQRDLGFRRPYEQVIPVAVPAASTMPSTLGLKHRCTTAPCRQPGCSATPCGWRSKPLPPPPMLARALSYLPDYDYDRIFCEADTRSIVMGLSLALITVAFGLFTRRRVET